MQAADTFRNNLRHIMEVRGVSQRDLALRAQTSYSGINRILQGKQTPTIDLADRLADSLEIPLSVLLEKKSKRAAKSA